jgi:hypothetical protein
MRKCDPEGPILATCKPDWDNLGKGVSDALNGIAMVLIFLTMVQSALSLHLSESRDDPALSRRFDRVSVVGFVVATLLLFVAIPWSAVGL